MPSDEEQIRELVDTWMEATRAGDVDTVLELMTDDVVFLVAGKPPMGKSEFAAQSRAQAVSSGPKIDGKSEIQEIVVSGNWAFLRSQLSVVMTPADGSPPIERAGYTLTVFKKEGDRWLLARDANLLTPVKKS
jgi:uncharacterized protein (TIGR02246 family)